MFPLLCATCALIAISLSVPSVLQAHVGGVDAQGGHVDRRNDIYHFHRGPLKGRSFDDKATAAAALAALGAENDDQPAALAQSTVAVDTEGHADLSPFWPASAVPGQIVEHSAYTLQYSEEHEQAAWVLYRIAGDQLANPVERSGDFRADPLVASGSATLGDYRGSGYDRGHLAPAAAMAWARHVMSESFYLSNMSPQKPGFNRGIWKELEAVVRDFARTHGEVIVVTGPVLQEGLAQIGASGVSIPKHYYKVVLDYREPDIAGIGFVLANEASTQPLAAFAVPIDSVETLTGIDFFHPLPDGPEGRIEGRVEIGHWFGERTDVR